MSGSEQLRGVWRSERPFVVAFALAAVVRGLLMVALYQSGRQGMSERPLSSLTASTWKMWVRWASKLIADAPM